MPAPPHVSQLELRGARRGPARAATLARDGEIEGNRGREPCECLLEVDLDDRLDVATGPARALAAPRPAEQVLAEERGEDVREAAEVHEVRLKASAAQPRMAVAVVDLAPVAVGEHLVRLGHLPEPKLGVRCARDVGMELARQRAERPLDLGVARAPRDTEHLVVVALRRRH